MVNKDFLIAALCNLCLLTDCWSQPAISFITIIETSTKDPVAYAEVSTGSSSFYADIDGRIKLNYSHGDSIAISRIGYESRLIPTNQIVDTIYLKPINVELPEVKIMASNSLIEMGYHRSRIIGWIGWAEAGVYMTMVTRVESDGVSGVIKHLLVQMKNQSKGTEYILSVFEKGENLKPGKLIYDKRFISANNKSLLKVNILDAGIEFPEEGLFVGIRVDSSNPDGNVSVKLTKTNGPPLSYFLYSNMWFEKYNLQPDYNLTYRIGLEIIPH